jgi:hypothetical protein
MSHLVAVYAWTQQKGGYLQASVAFLSLQERYGSRIRTLLVGGGGGSQLQEPHDDRPVEAATRPRREVRRDESFPMYEERSVRPDPVGLRYTYPEQAFGVKMTVDYVKRLTADDSIPLQDSEDVSVLHELGMEHFDVVFDSFSWCRAIRFVFDAPRGGFDPRWHSGDWESCLTSDMLMNSASASLNLEDYLQPSKQLFLDENEFLSSDLFNVTARIKRVDARIPAAIQDDVRSCDIVLKLDEAMLVVSSALPRTFLSGKLGSSVHGDDVAAKGEIDFPNDPSDVAYVIERSEDPSNRQRGIMTSRPISTFRLQLTLREATMLFCPVVLTSVPQAPHEVLAPCELTMILCFEGEPPERDSNLTKVVVFLSVLTNRLEFNIDFELLTSAISTLACHGREVVATVTSCTEVLLASSPRKSENKSITHNIDGKIVKSFSGRRVLVNRQIRKSRETGGVSVALCLQAAGISFSLWRQNVPKGTPLRTSLPLNRENDSQATYLPLLKLSCLDLSTIEVGLEASFRQADRRIVLKLCLSSLDLQSCDLARLVRAQSSGLSGDDTNTSEIESYFNDTSSCEHACMVKIARLGGNPTECFALRMEESLNPIRTWTLAGDLDGGFEMFCHVDTIEGLILLLLEVLLLPAWCNLDTFPGNSPSDLPWSFPPGSVGSLFISLFRALVPQIDEASFFGLQLTEDAKTRQVPGGIVDKILCAIIEKFIPGDVLAILVRLDGKKMCLEAPSGTESTSAYRLLIKHAEFLVSFFASDDSCQTQALTVLGGAQRTWSSIIPLAEKGLRHSLRSTQSLQYCCNQEPEVLVESFECGYRYSKGKASLLMSDEIKVDNVESLDEFLSCMRQLFMSARELLMNLLHVLSTVRRKSVPLKEVGYVGGDGDPVELACTSVVRTIRLARDSLTRANVELTRNHIAVQELWQLQKREIMKMRTVLFRKERERLNALALVSCQATGWLRIGSSQRIGQRGMMSWNLWPKWAVLRRSLLLLYPSPALVRFIRTIYRRIAPLPPHICFASALYLERH